MPWFKVDDKFHDHRKVRRVSLDAIGLWTLAGSWASDNLTDGFIPSEIAKRWSKKSPKLAAELVTAELWVETEIDGESGWAFHDWHERNPLRAKVEADREAARERMGRVRGSRSENVRPNIERTRAERSDEPSESGSDSFGNGSLTPSRPVPSPPIKSMSEVADAPSDDDESDDVPPVIDRDDVERVCLRLAMRMVENGCKRPAITNRWRESARLMLDRDGRTEVQLNAAIDWCQKDEFWRGNIHSIPKLRAQYDKLRLAAARGGKSNVHPVDFGAPPKDPKDRPAYAVDDVRNRFK